VHRERGASWGGAVALLPGGCARVAGRAPLSDGCHSADGCHSPPAPPHTNPTHVAPPPPRAGAEAKAQEAAAERAFERSGSKDLEDIVRDGTKCV
jgi:hypothetical protein